MMSNFPPGVTGSEWAIRGADEVTEFRECDCGFDGEVTVCYSGAPNSTGSATGGYWECPDCGRDYDVGVESLGPDPDEIYEREMDRRMDEHFEYL